MADTITYELPLNERVRTLLRLDLLARQFEHFANGTTVWDSRAAVETLLDAAVLVDRSDLRGELLKELERQVAIFAPLEQSPGVDVARLHEILDEFDLAIDRLKAQSGPLAPNLRTDEFLLDIQNRIGLPGGTCDFDLPIFHTWLERGENLRAQALQRWAEELKPVWQTADLMLHIIRGSDVASHKVAEEGSFQISFAPEPTCQMVRVILPAEVGYYPVMSGDRHRVTIRFMVSQPEGRPVQVQEDVSFQLICCIL
ncbi:Cell division protein ZapD [Gammaproteobacteria bacterium]